MSKKKQRNPAVTMTRRNGDVTLSDDSRELIERYLGGKVNVQVMAREFLEQEKLDSVRVILAQTSHGKMIVVKRAADLKDLIAAALPKLRMKKCNAVYIEGSPPQKIEDTLELPDDSRLVFKVEKAEKTPAGNKAGRAKKGTKEEKVQKGNKEDDEFVVVNDVVGGNDEPKPNRVEESDNDDEEEETEESDHDDEEEEDDEEIEAEEELIAQMDNVVVVSENNGNDEVDVEIVASDLQQRAKRTLLDASKDQLSHLKERQKEPRKHSLDFRSIRKSRISLPIDKSEKELCEAIQSHAVTIVRAPTGSGKSTRLVQYLLESDPSANVVITEPRRIAAMSVSDRVASELKSKLGDVVGFSVRTESQVSKNTQVLFCTVGVLLRRLAYDSQLEGLTHVIVDEAHERDVLTDLLLIFLRDLLVTTRKHDLKVIVLSATMDSSAFRDYFASVGVSAKEVSIEGMTYPIQVLFEEQFKTFIGGSSTQHQQQSRRNRGAYEELNVNTIEKLIDYYLRVGSSRTTPLQAKNAPKSSPASTESKRSILIFVSGRREILRVLAKLREDPRLEVYPLHSTLSSEEQRRVFRPSSDRRKTRVIVATNVAETSITIDDCGLVIDSGKFKESRYDADSRTWHLEETQISRSAMMQRRGRAGRTAPGVCYHLFSERLELEDQPKPGMVKDSLEDAMMALKAARGKSGDAYEFFSRAVSPPPTENVQRILEDLSDLGVIRGLFDHTKDATELTPLGYHLSKLGTDCRTGKLLLFGCFFGCLDPILTIASVLDGKSPWNTGLKGGQGGDKQTIRRLFGSNDYQAFVKARELFLNSGSSTTTAARSSKANQQKRGGGNEEEETTKSKSKSSSEDEVRRVLSPAAMGLNERIREDFIKDLRGAGFLRIEDSVEDLSRNAHDWRIVRICLAAGMFPNVARVEWDGSVVSGPHQLERSVLDSSSLWAPNLSQLTAPLQHQVSQIKGKGKTSKLMKDKSSSVQTPSRFFVFHERARLGRNNTSGPPGPLNLRKAIDVSPIALVLFGGGFTRVKSRKRNDPLAPPARFVNIRLGNCWLLQARVKDAFLLMQLRRVVDEALLDIYERKGLSNKDETLIRLIKDIAF